MTTHSLLTIDEACDRLRISKRGFYRLGLAAVRIGRGKLFYRAADIDKILDGGREPSPAELRSRAYAKFNRRAA